MQAITKATGKENNVLNITPNPRYKWVHEVIDIPVLDTLLQNNSLKVQSDIKCVVSRHSYTSYIEL